MKKEKKTSRRIGLARAFSKLGYCSRSQAAELIRVGQVRLNGKVRYDPETPVHLDQDHIAVDGHPLEAQKKIYLVMNKPRGLITTVSDEKGRDTVYSLLEKSESVTGLKKSSQKLPWVAPVGRLDKASEGLLLLTNDSEWGARITAPETHLKKTYHVQIGSLVDENFIQSLVDGIKIESETFRAKSVCILRTGQKNCWLEIVLDEGKNRQIRRMLAAFDLEVLRLVRVAIGPLPLSNLAKGAVRLLTKEEKLALDRAISATRLV